MTHTQSKSYASDLKQNNGRVGDRRCRDSGHPVGNQAGRGFCLVEAQAQIQEEGAGGSGRTSAYSSSSIPATSRHYYGLEEEKSNSFLIDYDTISFGGIRKNIYFLRSTVLIYDRSQFIFAGFNFLILFAASFGLVHISEDSDRNEVFLTHTYLF